ncbi:hypothetical protein GWO68_14345 [Pontibacter sp. BT213]|uniref:Uncharacterized protein n=1 Tax=Pontibacter fetidus TaxID=2700082 RepID=A0A6B2HB73_9BACT|nr:hypothetical protein [Pontibacter fetidus]
MSIVVAIVGCRKQTDIPDSSSDSQNYQFTIMDTVKGEQLLNQCSRSTPENINSIWELDKVHVEILDKNFDKVKEVTSSGCCDSGERITNLDEYVYQLVGVKIGNKSYIYINSFRREYAESLRRDQAKSKDSPVIVCDGGKSFWGILFDIEELKFSMLSINGSA